MTHYGLIVHFLVETSRRTFLLRFTQVIENGVFEFVDVFVVVKFRRCVAVRAGEGSRVGLRPSANSFSGLRLIRMRL